MLHSHCIAVPNKPKQSFWTYVSWLIVYLLLLVVAYKSFGIITLLAMLAWRWSALAHHYYLLAISRGEVIEVATREGQTPYVEGSDEGASIMELAVSYLLPVQPPPVEASDHYTECTLGVWKVYFDSDPGYVFTARAGLMSHPLGCHLVECGIFCNQHLERAMRFLLPPHVYNMSGMRRGFNVRARSTPPTTPLSRDPSDQFAPPAGEHGPLGASLCHWSRHA